MRVIQVPTREMLCPPKKRRKLRWRRARQAWDEPLKTRGSAGPAVAAGSARVVSSSLLNRAPSPQTNPAFRANLSSLLTSCHPERSRSCSSDLRSRRTCGCLSLPTHRIGEARTASATARHGNQCLSAAQPRTNSTFLDRVVALPLDRSSMVTFAPPSTSSSLKISFSPPGDHTAPLRNIQ